MKKLLFSLAAMIALVATSCVTDATNDLSVGGKESVVTFSVESQNVSRADIANGAKATRLQYAVFAGKGESMSYLETLSGETELTNLKASFDLTLLNQNEYTIVFWADAPGSIYTFTKNSATVTADYSNVTANNDNLDAFYAVKEFRVNGTTVVSATLTRPFAQVNFGANDVEDAENAGFNIGTLQSTFTAYVYNSLNLVSGELSGEDTVIFAKNDIPGDELKAGYTWVAMNYVFAAANGGSLNTCDLTITDGSKSVSISYPQAPVKRNWRTNLIGALLTGSTKVEVEVDPGFGGEEDHNYPYVGVVAADGTAVAYNTFAEAWDAVTGTTSRSSESATIRVRGNVDLGTTNGTAYTLPAGQSIVLDLGGATLNHFSDGDSGNQIAFDVRGNMTVNGGTITTKHTGADLEWSAMTEVFYVGFNGTLNLKNTHIENLGGSAMAYAVDLVNASTPDGVTLNVENSYLKSSYIPVRVFNNGAGMNNVTIKNSNLEGTSRAFWVHVYSNADNGGKGVKSATLNIDIFNPESNNTFIAENPNRLIEYGFTDEINVTPEGVIVIKDAEGNVIEGIGMDLEGNYAVTAATGLAWIDDNIAANNGFEGKTIKLSADIDLFKGYMDDGDPISTAPIGRMDGAVYGTEGVEAFKGTFDGQGHSIKNLYQNGWALNYYLGSYGAVGLFSRVENATIKNLVIDGCEIIVEGGNVSAIAANAVGNCTFENITLKNTQLASYNNGVGGIVAWSEAGVYNFKNIKIEESVVLTGLWGSYDTTLGGVLAEAEPGATYNFENVEISCKIDAFNDVISSYQWYSYRMCGMVVGRCEEYTTINGTNYPDLSKYNFTFNNVVVNYGDWMNYHYCVIGRKNGWRVEPGYSYSGLPADADHSTHAECCQAVIPFDQLVGGPQSGQHVGYYGLREVEGVTVNYPESFFREQGYKAVENTYTVYTGAGFKAIATTVLADSSKNVTIELANDIDLAGIEWPAVCTKAAFVLDGKGYSIKNLTTNAVEDHGFYSTAMFTSTRKATTIKNLVVENATVTGKGGDNSHGAVLVACNYSSLNIEGVTVKNSTVSNCDRSSVITTYLYFTDATVKNCVVEGCTVNSIGTAGALLGMNNSHNFEATGNAVKNTTISSSEGSNKAGIIIGTWQSAGTLTQSGNTVENSKAINAGAETNNEIGRTV